MSQLGEFESILKETVQAKRLSASKMTKLTEIALKSMEDDTQLASILYRTHKSLSHAGKISSLYVFDALSRAARHQANKQNLTGDLDSAKGNSATFLLRIEGILDGLFQDMLSSESPELKEKAKKVLDIWVKGNTFPAATLVRLKDMWKGKDTLKEPPNTAKATGDPRTAARKSITPPSTTTPPATTPQTPSQPDPQSTLLALLAQAVNAGAAAASAPEQNPSTPLQTELPQLALLQQLAQTVKAGPSTNPASSSLAPDLDSQFSYQDESYMSHPRSTQYNRYGSPDRRDNGSQKSPRSGYNSRTREDNRGRRTEYHRDRSPQFTRPRSSRSKSPLGRHGSRREYEDKHTRRQSATASAEKDEFGRDIRSKSPEITSDKQSVAATSSKPADPRSNLYRQTQSTPVNPSSTISPTTPTSPSDSSLPQTAEAQSSTASQYTSGIDQFNVAMFDFTSPAAWEALGKMWEASYGVVPTTEQLMQFVMTAGFGAAQGFYNTPSGWDNNMEQNAGGGDGGNGVSGFSGTETATQNSGGQMQKVGDKWQFVRSSQAAEISS